MSNFIDRVKIEVIAGHGGPGCVSFRREAYVPRGGPNGGNGGKGGDVIIKADKQLGTLIDLKYQQQYRAKDGEQRPRQGPVRRRCGRCHRPRARGHDRERRRDPHPDR